MSATETVDEIVCFAWNAGGLKICKDVTGGTGFFAKLKRTTCVSPAFFEHVLDIITTKTRLVAVCTEDESSTDTYFHSTYLPEAMKAKGFILYQGHKVDKVGEIASVVNPAQSSPALMSLLHGDTIVTGRPSSSALRLSVYCRDVDTKSLAIFKKNQRVVIEHSYKYPIGNFGAIGIHVQIENRLITFIGASLGHVLHSSEGQAPHVDTIIDDGMDFLHTAFRMTFSEIEPGAVFIMGDMGYHIDIGKEQDMVTFISTGTTIGQLRDADMLLRTLRNSDYPELRDLQEGIANSGPAFLPNWRMSIGRSNVCSAPVPSGSVTLAASCYNPFSEEGSSRLSLGWHDRILYKSFIPLFNISCIQYDTYSDATIADSAHSPVYGIYRLTAKPSTPASAPASTNTSNNNTEDNGGEEL